MLRSYKWIKMQNNVVSNYYTLWYQHSCAMRSRTCQFRTNDGHVNTLPDIIAPFYWC